MSVIARFKVDTFTTFATGGGSVELSPVYSEDPDHPNSKFWNATPSGSLKMHIDNESALNQFRAGDEYDVLFDRVNVVRVVEEG